MRIKLFEEFSEWDRDDFLFDLYAMSSTEVENLFWEELKSETPHLEKIDVMLESGLVNVRVEDKDVNGRTPLHWATVKNSIELAVLLLDRGADVEAKANDGYTPLHLASSWNRIAMAEFLIEKGADVRAKDNKEETPLDWAISDKMRALLRGN